MGEKEIDKKQIERLLPHREPMLLIDKLTKIVPLKSAIYNYVCQEKWILCARTFSWSTSYAWSFNR